MRKLSSLFIALSIFMGAKVPIFNYSPITPDVPTAIGVPEDPEARQRFELQMLANPQTGKIPVGMRHREVSYVKQLTKQKKYQKSLSTAEVLSWQPAGPYNVGGRTRAADFDVRDDDVIVAGGVSGGIWKTTDGGYSWEMKSSPDDHPSISFIAQDKRNGQQDVWYASSGEQLGNSARASGAPFRGNGIWKSTDNGENWELLESTENDKPQTFEYPFQYTWNFVVNPLADYGKEELLIAAYGGILRSEDGGKNWETVLGNDLLSLSDGVDLNYSADPSFTHITQDQDGNYFAYLSAVTSTSEVYAESGIYFSPDGKNWTKINPEGLASHYARGVLAVSPDHELYFLVYLSTGFTQFFRYSYVVSGASVSGSWKNLTGNIPNFGGNNGNFDPQGGYNLLVAVHPQNSNLVFVGGTNLYRSTDKFSSTVNSSWIGGYHTNGTNSPYPYHHADQHLICFSPNGGNKILSGHDGGLSISNNISADSVVYKSLNNGYVTSQFYTVSQDESGAVDEVIGGMQDNGVYLKSSSSSATSWGRLIGGDGAYTAIAPNKNFVYCGFQNGLIFRLMLDEDNDVDAFARVDPVGAGEVAGQEYLFINPYLIDPENANRLFIAGGNSIWQNMNVTQIPNGSQQQTSIGWEELTASTLDVGIYTALAKSGEKLVATIYDGDQPKLMVMHQAGDPFETQVEFFAPEHFPNGAYPACVAVSPTDNDEMMVVFSNYEVLSIFHSDDGGETFMNVGGNLEEFADGAGNGPSVRWAEMVPTKDGVRYFVGTSVGLFSTEALDGASTLWLKEGDAVIGKSVVSMVAAREADGRVLVGTHGRGAFTATISNAVEQSTASEVERLQFDDFYPNPVRGERIYIPFQLPADGLVRIDIIDAQGRHVRNVLWGNQYKGENLAYWDLNTAFGTVVPNGMYYCKINYGGKTLAKPIAVDR